MRSDCFFISHFWRQRDDPDPDGQYLRLHQAELAGQEWSYIWADWTCMPQHPRSEAEQLYFSRCLASMSGLIRNCGFIYFYPPFEPRLWILYEIAEFVLTCEGALPPTEDITPFLQHVSEMLEVGVQTTLRKYGYKCSFDRDREYLTSWLELLVLLRRLPFSIHSVRHIMDWWTWFQKTEGLIFPGLEVYRYEGRLVLNGQVYNFTPFPKWDDGKYF